MEFSIQFQEQLLYALPFTIIIAILVATILVKGQKKQHNTAPEPAGALPFVGHLHLLGKNQLIHRTFADMADKYGRAFSVRLGIHRALVVSNREVAKECFTTNDMVFLARPKSLAIKHMGYDHNIMGFAPYGPYWRNMRKLATVELLSNHRLDLLKHVQATEIDRFVKELHERSTRSGGVAVVEMKESIGDLTTNVIVRMIAGKRYRVTEGSCNQESRRCQKALADFLYYAGLLFVSDTIPFLGWIDVVNGNVGKMKRTAKEIDFALGSWINEHRERRLDEGSKEEDRDFIDVMLSIMDENNVPAEEADLTIKATCLGLVLGGNDSSVITLTWALSLLLNNRRVLKKAQDELDVHVGKQRRVEESDITNLVYLQAIIKETLRLYPAFPLVPREALKDCRVAGFDVPSGTRLLVNVWKLQRDPEIWHEPLDFLPERFIDEHANVDVKGQDFELIPFGSGRRICPGVIFALRFLHLALARLLHGFEWGTVSDKEVDMRESPGMLSPKATPLEVTLTPRLPSLLYS